MHADSLAVYFYDLQHSNYQIVLEIPLYFTRCQTWSNVTHRFCAKKKLSHMKKSFPPVQNIDAPCIPLLRDCGGQT